MIENTQYYQYAIDVTNGDIAASQQTINACKRFLADLQNPKFIFKPEKVERCLKFCKLCKHYLGKFRGRNFEPLPWQQFIIANIIGFYWAERSDIRRFNESYIEVPRKSGKTFLAAVLALYFLLADGEGSPQVILCAATKEQAALTDLEAVKGILGMLDPKHRLAKVQRSLIKPKDGFMKVVATDTPLDGLNVSFGLLDEFHETTTDSAKNALKLSMGARKSPHLATITTAGFDKSLPCYKVHTYCENILDGKMVDDAFFAIIYSIDDGDDWKDPNTWAKANPSLGITNSPDFIESEVQKAVNEPLTEVAVKTKLLDVWCDSEFTWIQDDIVVKSMKIIDLEQFRGDYCYIGIDLASVSDLTAVTLMFSRGGKFHFKTIYYIPSDALRTKQNREKYAYWQKVGDLRVIDGNVTDYGVILQDLLEINQICPIILISYDAYNSTQFIIDCTNEGFNCLPFSQALGSFNRPMKEFERMMYKGDIVIDQNEATRYCFQNVEIKTDFHGNCKPFKKDMADARKIDGVIAMLMALGGYLAHPELQVNDVTLVG